MCYSEKMAEAQWKVLCALRYETGSLFSGIKNFHHALMRVAENDNRK